LRTLVARSAIVQHRLCLVTCINDDAFDKRRVLQTKIVNGKLKSSPSNSPSDGFP
jgi:hypothetical protein